MLEIPEAYTISKQLNQTIVGKIITKVWANATPHKLAWYFNDPNDYHNLLINKKVNRIDYYGGQVEITVEDCRILFSDGINIRLFLPGEQNPIKHQLLIEFNDHSSLVCHVQMYGGLWAYVDGDNRNPYYLGAKSKTSPLSNDFNEEYFNNLIQKNKNLSLKAFLTTEQRIPGLGNGVLQDILFNARLHPKRKLNTLNSDQLKDLFAAVKSTLFLMSEQGGRDTEKDLFGNDGGYKTILSVKTKAQPCVICSHLIIKEAYMGGSIYYCENCQK